MHHRLLLLPSLRRKTLYAVSLTRCRVSSMCSYVFFTGSHRTDMVCLADLQSSLRLMHMARCAMHMPRCRSRRSVRFPVSE